MGLLESCSQIKKLMAKLQATWHSMAMVMWLTGLALVGGCDGRNWTDADPKRVVSAPAFARWASPTLDSLEALSIETLRQRSYAADIHIQQSIAPTSAGGGYQRYLGGYLSDGLAVYLRIDVPSTKPPSGGYPSVVFVHGWVGEQAAPDYDFELGTASASEAVIEAYVDAGFVVLIPGLRGHGTVSGSAAEGLEFLRAWDNRSYLSPIFYAIDVLNLIAGLESLERVDWQAWGREPRLAVRLDQARINLAGYSQGGDVALTALAVAGENSALATPIQAASIWAGCFASRSEQAALYGPMQDTAMAFTAGDGRWNGSATAADGRRNADFVFAYPSDLIVNPSPADWTWQADSWHLPTVEASLNKTYSDMYARYRAGIADLVDIKYTLERDDEGSLVVVHAAGLAGQLEQIGGYHAAHYLTEPINLHHSDRDFYSPPAWNANLATRVNVAGGRLRDFVYPGTTHSLSVSSEAWFSPAGTVDGRATMIARDIALFSGQEGR
ncbi:MAG: alpha/beta hydrolase family protein [Cellvibrionales bacterium]